MAKMANDHHERAEGSNGREAFPGSGRIFLPTGALATQQAMPLETVLVSNTGMFLGPTPRDNL